MLSQQFPPRKGPKINGVRRTLLPQGEANQPPPDREEKTTSRAMEGDKVRLIGTASSLNVHPKSQPLSHRKLPQTHSVPLSKPNLTQGKILIVRLRSMSFTGQDPKQCKSFPETSQTFDKIFLPITVFFKRLSLNFLLSFFVI